MTRQNGVRSPIGTWQIESARVSYFFANQLPFSSKEIWDKISTQPPTKMSENPAQVFSEYIGPLNLGGVGSQLVMRKSINRLDILVGQFAPSEMLKAINMNFIGPLDLLPIFENLILSIEWPTNFRPIRTAFGLDVLNPVPTRERGYELLSSYLNFDIDGANSSDLMYNINRPRALTGIFHDKNLIINRISKWMVSEYGFMLVPEAYGVTFKRGEPANRKFAIKISLDINSDAENSTDGYTLEVQNNILRNSFSMAKEIIENGDIS